MRSVLAVLLLAACSFGPPPAEETELAAVLDPPSSEVAMDFTNAEGKLVCPVMGDVIPSKAQAVGHTEHNGKVYWFCCDSCQHMFADDPERYEDGRFLAHLAAEHGGRFGNCNHVL